MRQTSSTMIDQAKAEKLAVFEKILKSNLKRGGLFAIISQTLLDRVHCRQQEWAERNWLKSSVQTEFHQLLKQAKINPPVI